MPGRFRLLADSPLSTMISLSSAPCTSAMARIFSACASSENLRFGTMITRAWFTRNPEHESARFHRGPVATRFQQAIITLAGRSRFFYGVARHDDSEHCGAHHRGGTQGGSVEHEVGAGQLYLKSRGLHSDQWVDGGSLWNASGVRVRDRPLHVGVISLRHIE